MRSWMTGLLVLLCAATLRAADDFYAALDTTRFREAASLNDGRRKPVDSLARERVEFVSGREGIQGQDPVVTFLSMVYEPTKWMETPCIYVKDAAVLSALNAGRKGAPLAKWISQVDLARAEERGVFQQRMAELEKDTSREGREKRENFVKAVGEVRARATDLQKMPERFQIVPLGPTVEKPWLTLGEAAQAGGQWGGKVAELGGRLAQAFASHDAKEANSAMDGLADLLPRVNLSLYPAHDRLVLETALNRVRPLHLAWIVYFVVALLGVVQLCFAKNRFLWAVMLTAAAGLLLNLSWVVARGVLAERWPLGNFYEVIGMVALIVSLIAFSLGCVYRTGYFIVAGTLASANILMIAEMLLPLEFRMLSPLVPVLRSYWLQYHVTCMACAYSGGTLAAFVSVLYLVRWAFGNPHPLDLQKLDTYIYRTVQVAFVFFTAGIMLGALWANESWGRYWGWDPKEIWALICWLIYAAYLHGKMIGWFRGHWAAAWCLIGFGAVLFTFYGVNFWLKGLHSYAN